MDGWPETQEVNGEEPTAQHAGQGNDAEHGSMQATVGGALDRQPPPSEASKPAESVANSQVSVVEADADADAQGLSFGRMSVETGKPGSLNERKDLPVNNQDVGMTEAINASENIGDVLSSHSQPPSEREGRLEEPTRVAPPHPRSPPTGSTPSPHQPQHNTAATVTTVDASEVLPGSSMGVPVGSPMVHGARTDATDKRETEEASPTLGLRRLDSDTTASLEFLLTLNDSSSASGEEEGGMERGEEEEASGEGGRELDSDAQGGLCLLLMGGGGASEIEEMLQGEEQQDGEDYQDRNRDREELILLVAQLRRQVKKLESERDALEDMLVEEQLRNHSHQASEVASSLFSEGPPPGLAPLHQPPHYLQAGEPQHQAQGGAARDGPSLDLHDSLEALMSWSEVHDTMLSDDSAEAAREPLGEGQQPAAASEDMLKVLLAEGVSTEGPLEEMLVHEQMNCAALGLELEEALSRVMDLEEEGAILRDSLVRAEVFRFYLFQKLWQQQRQIERLGSAERREAGGQSMQLRAASLAAPGNQEPVRGQLERQQKDRGAKKKRKLQHADVPHRMGKAEARAAEADMEPGSAVGALKTQVGGSADFLECLEGQLSTRSNAARVSLDQPMTLGAVLAADSFPGIHATVSEPAKEAALTSAISDFQWLVAVLGEVREGPWFDKCDDAFLTPRHSAYLFEDSDAGSESPDSLSCLLELGAAELAGPQLLGAEGGGAFELSENEFGSERSFVRELFEAVQEEDALSACSSGSGEADGEAHALRERMALLQLVADVLPCSPRGDGEHEERESILLPQHNLREPRSLPLRSPWLHGTRAGHQQALHGVFRMERREQSSSILAAQALNDEQTEPLSRQTQSQAAQESTDTVLFSGTRSEAYSREPGRQQLLSRSEDNAPAKALPEPSAVQVSKSQEPRSVEETEIQDFLKRLCKLVRALPASPRGEEDRSHTQGGQHSPLAHLAKSQSHRVEALPGRTEDLMQTRSQTSQIRPFRSEGLPSARAPVGPLRHQETHDQPTNSHVPAEGLLFSTEDAPHHEQPTENRDSTVHLEVQHLGTGAEAPASAEGDMLTQVLPLEELQPDLGRTKRLRIEEHKSGDISGDAMQDSASGAPRELQSAMMEAASPVPQAASEVEALAFVEDSEAQADEQPGTRELEPSTDKSEADVRDECEPLSEAPESGASELDQEPPDQALGGSGSAPELGLPELHVPVETAELGVLDEVEVSDLGSVAAFEEAQDPELHMESLAVTPGASTPGALTEGSSLFPEDVASFLHSLATEGGVPESQRVEPELVKGVECKALEIRPEASSISVPLRLQKHPWHPQDSDLQHLLHKAQARHCVSSVVLGIILPRTPVSRSAESLGSMSGPREKNGVGLTGVLFKALPSPEASVQKPSVYKHLKGYFAAGQ